MTPDPMADLVRWFGEQLDADERIARAATSGPWWYNPGKQWLGPDAFEKYDLRQGEEFVGYGGPHPFTGAVAATGPANNPQSMRDAAFIAAWDPARVLREIDDDRELVKTYAAAQEIVDALAHPDMYDVGRAQGLEEAVRRRSLAFSARPGYREEWKP
ncbi:DUF6221 family protein [Streptomyces sp. NBC_01483]|uniref:DUF6221 family protein n=1 Tax=Streptomyces sp. NBC_01483 TaxID=2903883 RepID=UPI002E309F53|nr:DUF6221 family protein [Streptomyces sp. NBC_01483]